MNRKVILIFLMLIGLETKSNADSIPHIPNSIVKDSYFETITEELIRPFSKQIFGIYLVIPSFEPEYVLLLDYENGKVLLKYRRYKKIRWYTLQKDITPQIESKSIEISKESQGLLMNFIKKAYSIILNTKKSAGLDGETYYFMIPDSTKSTMLRAEIWSPKIESESYRIIQQTERIIKHISDPNRNEKDLKIIIKDRNEIR